jgi:hypothetical protein
MAIQFDCPYCTATMQVPDSVMGTIGRCPKCGTRLRVPVIEIPVARHRAPDVGELFQEFSPEPAAGEAETQELPRIQAPRAASPAAAVREPAIGLPGFLMGADDTESPAAIPVDEVTVALQRRLLHGNRGWIWVTVAFALAAAGIGFGYWWQSQKNIVHSLAGEMVTQSSVTSVISQRDFKLPDADWANIRKSLEQKPADLRSRQMEIRLESAPRGIKVVLKPGKDGELIAVPLLETPGLAELIRDNFQALDQPRKTELQEALSRLSKVIEEATAAGKPPNLSEFGMSVGVNSLIGPVGFHTHAVVDRNAFPCVFEDRDGRAYYLVPPGTEAFVVRPKTGTGSDSLLPEGLQVQVTVERKDVPSTEEDVAPPAEPAVP